MRTAEELMARRGVVARVGGRRRRGRAPRATLPRGAELRYARLLRALVGRLQAAIVARIVPLLGEPAAPSARMDAPAGGMRRTLGEIEIEIGELLASPEVQLEIAAVAGATSRHGARELSRLIGLRIRESDPAAAAQIPSFLQRNTALITKMVRAHTLRIAEIIDAGQTQGLRSEVIAGQLAQQGLAASRRALLIARDQVLTLNSQITQSRHQALGITHYFWSTSNDEVVRGSEPGDSQDHVSLDGQRFAYADPPSDPRDGVQAHPGERINCRCVAIPDTSGLLDMPDMAQ